jgi:CHAT domain-containing protein
MRTFPLAHLYCVLLTDFNLVLGGSLIGRKATLVLLLTSVLATSGILAGLRWIGPQNPREFRRGDTVEGFLSSDAGEQPRGARELMRQGDVPRADVLTASGLARLLASDIDSGVKDLERATRLKPDDASLWSDLAAGYLTRSRQGNKPDDLISSLTAAERAVSLHGSLARARFNRALALENLSLVHSAAVAWEEYLQLDQSSWWSAEARLRLAALKRPRAPEQWQNEISRLERAAEDGDFATVQVLVRRFPAEAREWAEENLLGIWGEAVLQGRTDDAGRAFAKVQALASALVSFNGEQMPQDAVAAIEVSSRGANPDRLVALAEGHRLYHAARMLYRTRDGDAGRLFKASRNAFLRGRSPMAGWATLYLAILTYDRFDLQAAREMLLEILEHRTESRYPTLAARAGWMLGLVSVISGDPAASIEAYRSALRLAEKVGAEEDVLGIQTGLAGSYQYLGDYPQTWRALHAGLTAAREVGSVRRRHALLDVAAETCLVQGRKAAARYFRDEMVRLAEEDGEPVAISHALLQRSAVRVQEGDFSGAGADLDQARGYLDLINRPELRRRVEADLLAATGELQLRTSPAEAYASLTQALAFHAGKENHYDLARIHLARARAALKSADLLQAETDLRLGIEEYERQRRLLVEEQLRISFFDQSRALFEEMIGLQAIRTDGIEEVFNWAERARARVLLDRIGSLLAPDRRADLVEQATSSLTAREVMAALPSNVAFIEYVLLQDRLFALVLHTGSIELVQVNVSAAEVERRTAALQRALVRRAPEVEVRATSAALHDILIRPISSRLDPGELLVFAPDRVLHTVPFAALFDRRAGSYLVERGAVVVASSATLFLRSLERNRELGRARGALVVGNPRFRRDQAPQLLPLPWAEAEAEAIASMFPGSLSLLGEQATKERFLADAGSFGLVHFAGHAEINQEFPLLSYLLLAPDDDTDPGFLYAHEFYGAHLDRTHLVVLAACGTASGPASGEGVISLGRAFLAAGVPAVVASLWSIGDRPTGQFFHVFYQHLRRNGDAAASLRSAQLSMLASSDPGARSPASWAAFELFGSATFLETDSKYNR